MAANNGLLQRKCACGKSASGGEHCEQCKKKTLQRRASSTSGPAIAPPIVHDVLRSPGQPLDKATREFMEPKFGCDFSQVRVHSDSQANESASAINAHAYTVGPHVVFSAGTFMPHTRAARRLLAHELTHVAQQDSKDFTGSADGLGIGPANDSFEREADAVSHEILNSQTIKPLRITDATRSVQRDDSKKGDDTIPVELYPVPPGEQGNIDLPKVSQETWKMLTYKPGQKVPVEDIKTIEGHLQKASVAADAVVPNISGPKFLLHDTSSLVSAKSIQEQQQLGRGPLGKGVSAWVPKAAAATIARPNFYESRRPTTTEYEKDIESFKQPGDDKLKSGEKADTWKKRRDDAFRTIWDDTQPAERATAMDRALAAQNLTPDEIKGEKTGNKKERKDPNFTPGIEAALKTGSAEKMTTSASWTVEEICSQLTPTNIKSKAVSGKEQELTDACAGLTAFFAEKQSRVGSTVTVEIVQPGVISDKGDKDTCNPKNPNLAPLSNPPYTDLQYQSIVTLYLRAALMAGVFPEVTTHFAADAFIQGHCDPRCFDLTKLYQMIATALGHSTACVYGVTPSYGRRWGTNNVWWDDKICHGGHP